MATVKGSKHYRWMGPAEVERVAEIDRAERVTLAYEYRHGRLHETKVDWNIPRWREDGNGEHSVASIIQFCRQHIDEGGLMLGAFDGAELVGVGILKPRLTGRMAQLAFLHVSRGYRRQGVASEIVDRIGRLARKLGATHLYVSATPTESAVSFYLKLGFHPADKVHPGLYALEPEDIHLVKSVTS